MFKVTSITAVILLLCAQTETIGEEVIQQSFNRNAYDGVQVPLLHCQKAQEKGLFLGTEKKEYENAFGKGSFYSWVYHLYDDKLYMTAHYYYALRDRKARSDVLCFFQYEDLSYRQ